MDSFELLSGWIKTLGNTGGKSFTLQPNGVFAVTDEFGQNFSVELKRDSGLLYFCSQIANISNNPNRYKYIERLMQWNSFGIKTRYCTLSLDENKDIIMMHYVAEIEKLDELSFINIFVNFISQVNIIKCELDNFLSELSTPQDNFIEENNKFIRI